MAFKICSFDSRIVAAITSNGKVHVAGRCSDSTRNYGGRGGGGAAKNRVNTSHSSDPEAA